MKQNADVGLKNCRSVTEGRYASFQALYYLRERLR